MNKKVSILFSSFPDFSGNPKALFEYIYDNYRNNFNLFWVFQSTTYADTFKKRYPNVNYVVFGTDDYYEALNNIDIIFDTHGALLSDKKDSSIYVNLWHGSSPKEKGYLLSRENFAPQDDFFYKQMHLKADYVITPSLFSKLVFSSAFDINAQQVIPLGYCRDDYLFNSDGRKLLKKITNIDIDKFDKILCYLPTYRVGLNRKDSKGLFRNNLLELNKYEEQELYSFLEENNYLLIIKKHPSDESAMKSFSHKNILILDEDILSSNFITIYDILNSIDLLIADYSSIYIEYLLLDRPILFLHKNLKSYTKHRGIILNNIDFWTPGPQVTTFKNFKNELLKLLSDNTYYSKERLSLKKIMFDENYSNYCKQNFDYFFDDKTFKIKVSSFASSERDLITRYKSLENENGILSKQLIEFKTNSKALKNEVNTLIDKNNSLQEEIDAIHNSRIWKLYYKFKTKKE